MSNINKLIEELDAKYEKATPMTMHSNDPSIEYAFAVANAYPDLRKAILELQKQADAGKELAEAVEKGSHWLNTISELVNDAERTTSSDALYAIVCTYHMANDKVQEELNKSIKIYRESIKGV